MTKADGEAQRLIRRPKRTASPSKAWLLVQLDRWLTSKMLLQAHGVATPFSQLGPSQAEEKRGRERGVVLSCCY